MSDIISARTNVRILQAVFRLAWTRVPTDTPIIEETIDSYVMTQADGTVMPGVLSQRRPRRALLNPRPSEVAAALPTTLRAIAPATATALNALAASIGAGLAGSVSPVVETVSGLEVRRFDRVYIGDEIVVTPVFVGTTPDLPNFLIRVQYQLRDASGVAFNGTQSVEKIAGPSGWNLDLVAAAALLNEKVLAVRGDEGIGS